MKNLYRAMREDRGLSQTEAARRLGISQAALANIEAGRREPSPDLRARLDVLLAYGEPGNSREPAYLLAAAGRWLADKDDYVAVFQSRKVADDAAGLLGLLAYARPELAVTVVPVWPSWLAEAMTTGPARVIDAGPVDQVLQRLGGLISAFGNAVASPAPPPTFAPDVPVPDEKTTPNEVLTT